MATDQHTVCIAGGGPAGMMLGFLLARAGVDVLVLEKHADFLRDFRGDTVHPSTLEVMKELGLLETFLKRPHQRVYEIGGSVGGTRVKVADFRHLKDGTNFIAFVPQWHFLDFLVEQARRYPTFHLEMRAEVTGLLEEGDRVVGVRVQTPAGTRDVSAALVVGADGRRSRVRDLAKLDIQDFGAPIDVLWMRISRHATDPRQALGSFDRGRMFVMLDRDEYWQCGYIIAKGGFPALQKEGLPSFQDKIKALAPFLGERVYEIDSWDKVSLLTVRVDRLRQWFRPGLLCIGDAAHAMSPVGGVGINLAIQDAVAAANILSEPLRQDTLSVADLERVQRRRELPTELTQRFQVFAHERVITRALTGSGWSKPPWPMRLLDRVAPLRRIPAYLVGIGIRPEHVTSPNAFDVS